MKNRTIGNFTTIDAFVSAKLARFSASAQDFGALFDVMFSEGSNVMFERSEGIRITKRTYDEVRSCALLRAAALDRELSFAPEGCVVGLLLPNGEEWIEAFWAVLLTGRRPLLMNPLLDRTSLKKALDACSAAAVIAESDPGFGLPTLPPAAFAPGDEEIESPHFGEEVIFMSSGTSESIKLCAYSAKEFAGILGDSAAIIRRCPAIKRFYNGELKLLAFLPFCHIFGFVAVYLWFGFFSRTFVLLDSLAPDVIVDTIRRHNVTHIFAVPLFWNRVYDEALRAVRARGKATERRLKRGLALRKALAPIPLAGSLFGRLAFREVRRNLFGESIRFLISGGGEIPSPVLEFFNGIGYRLANGYGMTEIGITSVELSSNYKKLTGGSIGLPLASAEYRVDGGQLFVKSASMAKRILESGSERDPRGEWFATGDLAEQRSGRYYILGRMDDVVISPSGENLNPCLIEQQLLVSGVRECCLTRLNENGRIAPVLVVSLKPLLRGEAALACLDALSDKLRALNLESRVGRVVAVREPLIGEKDFKLNRRRVAERLASGCFTVVERSVLENVESGSLDPELLLEIRSLFARETGRDVSEIAESADFFLDLGGSSLEYFSAVGELQSRYGVAFPAEEGHSLSRPDEIARFITEAANREGS